MYFLSASACALLMYWINYVIVNYYQLGDAGEVVFFNKYLVMLLLGIVPFSTALTFIFFYRSGFNFPEIAVMQLYCISFFLLIVVVIQCLKFIWPELETRFIEIPVILLYNAITFVNFFRNQNKWLVAFKSLICGSMFFGTIAFLQDKIVDTYLR
jgi:hypothetical protein